MIEGKRWLIIYYFYPFFLFLLLLLNLFESESFSLSKLLLFSVLLLIIFFLLSKFKLLNKGNKKKNNYISRRGKSNKNINYNKGDEREDFNLNQVLLTEDEVDKGPKRPPRRNSVRMSIFIRNMNKVETVSASKLMKVKKKKKKYT